MTIIDEENLPEDELPQEGKAFRISGRQKKMLEALFANAGNVSVAARACGVGRTTHYLWLENNPKYTAKVLEIGEELVDLAESKLLVNIDRGDQKAIQYYLDSKAKDRGYGQTKRVEVSGPEGSAIQHEDVSDKVLKDKLEDLGVGGEESQLDGKLVE